MMDLQNVGFISWFGGLVSIMVGVWVFVSVMYLMDIDAKLKKLERH